MAEKNFNNIRIVNKHDTEDNWLKATGFTPKQGELIVYDIDSNYSYERIKIGDGVQNVNALPFYAGSWEDLADKPFGVETILNRTTMHETTIDNTSVASNERYLGYDISDLEDKNVIVTVNGVEYESICEWDGTSGGYRIVLGDDIHEVYQAATEFNSTIDNLEAITYEVKIEVVEATETVVTLDEKYIPDTIARVSDVDEVKALVGDVSVSEQINTAIDEHTHSWNDLEDRPLVMESITITYDGSTDGYVTSAPVLYYKVSDFVLTNENIIGQSISLFNQGAVNTATITEDMIMTLENTNSFAISEFVICISEDNTIFNSYTLPEKGVYFANINGIYVASLGAVNVGPFFDEKYISSTIARREDIVQSDWSEGNQSSLSYVKNKTHYYYEGAPMVEELSFTVEDEDFTRIDPYLTFEEGKKYKVVIDGVMDICTAVHVYDAAAAKNYIELTPTIDGFGMVRSRLSGGVCTYIAGVSIGDHVLSVYNDNELKQLDEMFIPDTIARVSDIEDAIASTPAPDVSGQIETHNTSEIAHSDIRESINAVSVLVGDTSVSEQIDTAIAEIPDGFSGSWNDLADKPFGESITLGRVIAEEQVAEVDMGIVQTIEVKPIKENMTYLVKINGNEYITHSKFVTAGDGYGCGNAVFAYPDFEEDTGEPFYIENDGMGSYKRVFLYTSLSDTEVTVSITEADYSTQTLDEVYIPATIARTPKLTTVTFPAASWTGDANPWSQVVTVNGVTANSKVDLRATALQVVELQNNDIAFMAENDDGVVTVYALGSKPTVDYTIQAEITEVVVV